MNLRKHFWKMYYNSDFSRHVNSHVEQTKGAGITARGAQAEKAKCLEYARAGTPMSCVLELMYSFIDEPNSSSAGYAFHP